MQIEQVIGGVGGDVNAQAIQLRMRSNFQNQMQFSRIRAWDAAGLNPVLLADFVAPVPNQGTGVRVLAATASFAALTTPSVTPDAIMNPIPAAYLPAGSITFEDDGGLIYWRLSWGGAAYTGSGAGSMTNDPDGNFNPPFVPSLPSGGNQAVLFQFAAAAASTNNANDYALTGSAAVFQGNTGASGTVTPQTDVEQGTSGQVRLGRPVPNPTSGILSYSVTLPRAAKVRIGVFDLSGRLIHRLVDRELGSGRQLFQWDARAETKLKSGVYVLRLESEGIEQTRKFSFVR